MLQQQIQEAGPISEFTGEEQVGIESPELLIDETAGLKDQSLKIQEIGGRSWDRKAPKILG